MEIYYCDHSIRQDLIQQKFTPSSSPDDRTINFHFNFDIVVSHFVQMQDSTRLSVGQSFFPDFDTTSVTVRDEKTLEDLFNETHEAISGVLSRCLPEFGRDAFEPLILSAWFAWLDLMYQMSVRDCGDLELLFHVQAGHSRIDVGFPDGEGNCMVPAAESSIESLDRCESGVTAEMSCCICQEGFSGGSDGALSMPCSHVFHGDCIRQWLRTSHYCPLCRFEMPISYDLD